MTDSATSSSSGPADRDENLAAKGRDDYCEPAGPCEIECVDGCQDQGAARDRGRFDFPHAAAAYTALVVEARQEADEIREFWGNRKDCLNEARIIDALCDAVEALTARDPRGIGNGPVAGRFVLLHRTGVTAEDDTYVTSWDTWDECSVAFPIEADFFLLDGETGCEWLPGAAYEWEAART